jgi:hypothetical protein
MDQVPLRSVRDGAEDLTLISACDVPLPSPCCALAHEQGYRHGYAHGYTYALWDVGTRLTSAMWDKAMAFTDTILPRWRNQAARMTTTTMTRDLAPRFSLTRRSGPAVAKGLPHA